MSPAPGPWLRLLSLGAVGVVALVVATGEHALPHDAAQLEDSDDPAEHRHAADHATAFLKELRTVLAPLFDLYGISDNLRTADRATVLALLHGVRFAVENGSLVVTNRKTGGVIFTGQLDRHVDAGELRALFTSCAVDPRPTGARDAAAGR